MVATIEEMVDGLPHHTLACSGLEVHKGDILVIDREKAAGEYVAGERRVLCVVATRLGLADGTKYGAVVTWIPSNHRAIVEHRPQR